MAANACLRLTAVTCCQPQEGVPNSKYTTGLPGLYIKKPSCAQSAGRSEMRTKAKGRCVICHGTGRVDCFNCRGKGRTNCVDLEMLPKGERPKWCSRCGGSGLGYCSRCLGTGEYRSILGFRLHDDVDP